MDLSVYSQQFRNIAPVTEPVVQKLPEKKDFSAPSKFELLLNDAIGKDELKFSAHAKTRISSRNIDIDSDTLEKLKSGVKELKEKGAGQSLVVSGDYSFIVSVKNDTVITVVDKMSMEKSMVTNIDSAMFI